MKGIPVHSIMSLAIVLFPCHVATSQPEVYEAWIARYNGSGNADDRATDLAMDSSGNLYVTGHSSSPDGDFVTIKYDVSGEEQWVARYNGSENGDDVAYAIAVDGSGNLYVTGPSVGPDTSYDYATIKYNASGLQQWVARYDGAGNGDDNAYDLTIDRAGNVYVTGSSNSDFATIKYSSSGAEEWVAHYNGPQNGDDRANAIAVDSSGNVYVTGYSGASTTDCATIKYSSSGAEEWVALYDAPGQSWEYATALAVDDSGNVCITGYTSNGLTEDYVTIKYDASGSEKWVARYNGPGNDGDVALALALDDSGNAYVTGYSYSSVGAFTDYSTIKYDPWGQQKWVARYNGPGSSSDVGTAIVVDGSGNVYVTGYSTGSNNTFNDYATIKYDPLGIRQWVSRYSGPGSDNDNAYALTVDGSGNVYVTGYSYGTGTFYDFATIKYDSSGDEEWVERYNGPGNLSDHSNALAVDGSGNVYVTGTSGSSSGEDYATTKYNSSGNEEWVTRYNGPGNSSDGATALAIDASGNVYVTGYSDGGATLKDYATIKYDASGAEQWIARYNGPGNGDDVASALAIDSSGNVYVTGYSYGGGTLNKDFATVKYDASGAEDWVDRYNGPGSGDDVASALVVDGSGKVYVTGYSYSTHGIHDYATIKYYPWGQQEWVERYNGPVSFSDYPTALAVDGSGNVYVTGSSEGFGTSDDYATIKYDLSGIEEWVARYSGPGYFSDGATALALDGSGNVYVTGYRYSTGELNDYGTIKYNSAGTEQWVSIYNGPGNTSDHANALAVDARGNVYVTGYSGIYLYSDFVTIKYDSSGSERWMTQYNGPANDYDASCAIAIDGSGNIYVTGASAGTGTFDDYTTIKYGQAQSPTQVSLLSPSNGATINTDSVIFLWHRSSPEVDRYWFEYATDSTFAGSAVDSALTDTTATLTQVQQDQTYWWRVRAHNSLGWGPFSETWSFTTLITEVEDRGEIPAEFSLSQNYPNPFNPTTVIQYGLPKRSHVKLELFSLIGQRVAILVDADQEPGYHSAVLESKHLASGMYFYRLEAGDFVETRKLIVLR